MRKLTLGVCALVLAANLWHHLFVYQPLWDDAWYRAASFLIYNGFHEAGWTSLTNSFIYDGTFSPPMVVFLPLPFYLLFGPNEFLPMLLMDGSLIVTWYAVYLIGCLLYNEKAGCASVMACALQPLIFGMYRFYLIECLLTAIVAWVHWVLLKGDQEPSRKMGFKLGLLYGVGLLTKQGFPIYVLATSWIRRKIIFKQWWIVGLVAGGLASTWYYTNGLQALQYLIGQAWVSTPGLVGPHQIYSPSIVLDYLNSVLFEAISWPYLVVAVGIFFAAWKTRSKEWRIGSSEKFLLAWVGFPMLIFTFIINQDLRFLMPAFPGFSILIGAAVASIVQKQKRAVLWLLPSLGVLLYFVNPYYGITNEAASQIRGVPHQYQWPPRIFGIWNRTALLEAIRKDSGNKRVTVAMNLDHQAFNYLNMGSLALSHDWPLDFSNWESRYGYLSHVQPLSLKEALIKFIDYVVLVEGNVPKDFGEGLNSLRLPMKKLVAEGSLPTREVSRVQLIEGVEAVIYKVLHE